MENDEQESEETIKECESRVTSSNPEERKLARRLRIQRRIEAIKKQREQEDSSACSVVEKHLLDKQVEVSALFLEQLLVEGDEIVTNIRVGNDTREVKRRAKESSRRAEILRKLEDESNDAEKKYEDITNKWDIITEYKDPLDISDSIASQRELCDVLIKQKDEIIAMLRQEINHAEIKYVHDQETQQEDVTALVRRIDNQVDLMRKSYKRELQLIESTIATERKIINDENDRKWEILHKQRNLDEERNMVKKMEMADEFLQIFYETRVEHEETYRKTKIAMETEIEVLRKELEQLKAACLLNGEKLDYNYNILKKREDENLIIRSEQKRLINKLQDEINTIKRNIQDTKIKYEEDINKLVLEIQKARNSVFQIENKADHICRVNDKKYQDVWELNEELALKLVAKIKTTDRIIHEQLLGLEWKPPTKNFVKKNYLASYKEAMDELSAANHSEEQDQKVKTSNLKLEEGKEIPHSLLKSILDKIAFRSGFLLEETLHKILPGLSEDNTKLVRADNVFNAIGITESEHLKILSDIFMPYAKCPICDGERLLVKRESSLILAQDQAVVTVADADEDILKDIIDSPAALQEIVESELENPQEIDVISFEDTSTLTDSSLDSMESTDSELKTITSAGKIQAFQCNNKHPIYVENANVYKLLRKFIKLGFPDTESKMTLKSRMDRKRNSLSRLLRQEDVVLFWSQFTSMFSKYHEELWNALLYGLKKYHTILNDRHKIYQDVIVLRKENAELRHMLQCCSMNKTSAKKKK